MTMVRRRLGELLVKKGFLSKTMLTHILIKQQLEGGRLGDLLISQGIIGYYDLYRTVAELYALPFVNLLDEPPRSHVIHATDIPDYLRLRLIPWRIERGYTTVALCDVSDEAIAWIKKRFGNNIRLVITSPFDIRRTVEIFFGASLEKDSCLSLWNLLPQASAKTTISEWQKWALWGLCFCSLGLAFVHPILGLMVLITFCHVTYNLTLLFKCWVFAASQPIKRHKESTSGSAAITSHNLPVYTVLVPMYNEAETLPKMLSALKNIDYPSYKLDIKLILEADDDETLDAAYALKPHYQFDIIRVPVGLVRTKPKACNYALKFAQGEFVTVFDADDQPDALQLKKAVHAFRTLPPDVVCLQARLNYYNYDDNVLTRCFALEYSILFNFMLPGLERLGIPIPLGGTSNHIALARLREEGEWDPYNVTEDADLGTRFAAHGYRTVMLDSWTMEEATNTFKAWNKQRSRWIKGYMQTWLVHMRNPYALFKALGWKGFIGFQFFIGLSTFTFFTAPLVWAVSLLWGAEIIGFQMLPLPDWLLMLTFINMCLNFSTHWCFTFLSVIRYHKMTVAMFMAAFIYPLYMILHSVASYKALAQLIVKPHFWEKTTHGVAHNMPFTGLKEFLSPA